MVSGGTLFPAEAGSLSSERLWSRWWGICPPPETERRRDASQTVRSCRSHKRMRGLLPPKIVPTPVDKA